MFLPSPCIYIISNFFIKFKWPVGPSGVPGREQKVFFFYYTIIYFYFQGSFGHMGCAGRRGLSKRKIAIWVPRAEIRADTPARGPLSLPLLYHSRLDLSIVKFNKKKSEFSFALCFHFTRAIAAIFNAIGTFFAPLARTENFFCMLNTDGAIMKPSHNSFAVSFFSCIGLHYIVQAINHHNPMFHVTSPILPVRARKSALH